MKRREFFEKAGLGSAALVTLPGFSPKATPKGGAQSEHGHDGKHEEMTGPLASADVRSRQAARSVSEQLAPRTQLPPHDARRG